MCVCVQVSYAWIVCIRLEFVTNGSDHWILCHLISKAETMARGTQRPICGNQ